jgi:hypothetical protein
MGNVIRAVDHDTLARTPERREEKANQLQKLGNTLEKAGIYLAEYSSVLEEENVKSISKEIVHEFYLYGLSLQGKKMDQISEQNSLSEKEKTYHR